jgi:hypothetical protein
MNLIKNRRSVWGSGLAATALVLGATAGSLPARTADAAVVTPSPSGPNEVVKWNAIAQDTVLAQAPNASSPPAAAVFMAMVQGAVYGAVNSIEGRHRPYLIRHTPGEASKRAAAATAAFTVLDTLFPAQHTSLQTHYDASMAGVEEGARKEAGIDVGRAAAAAMLDEGHDARTGPIPPLPPDGPGYWEPLLRLDGSPILDPTPWVALAPTFVVKSPSQFRSEGPLDITSDAYADEFDEVKALGATDSTLRSPTQTHVAVFWQSNAAATWNGVARRLAEQEGLGLLGSATMFALMDLSTADATISCWNDKYHYGFWRPMAAIREADTDGNAQTEPDTDWTPLFTPPYPDHPSGHLCLSSSSLNALRAFFGTDEMPFYVTSSQFPGEQRPFARFSDAVDELLDARIWAGLHFRNADEQGAQLGREVARYVHLHYFASLR